MRLDLVLSYVCGCVGEMGNSQLASGSAWPLHCPLWDAVSYEFDCASIAWASEH